MYQESFRSSQGSNTYVPDTEAFNTDESARNPGNRQEGDLWNTLPALYKLRYIFRSRNSSSRNC